MSNFKPNGRARKYVPDKSGRYAWRPAEISNIVETTRYATVRFEDGTGYFGPEGNYEMSQATKFHTINDVSCRIDEDGNLDLANGEVIKFSDVSMDHYDIDGGLIQSCSADKPEYKEWKARYDALVKIRDEGLPSYVDSLDADEQISAEEWIAAQIFDNENLTGIAPGGHGAHVSEQACADLGRDILKGILWRFRKDLFITDDKPKTDNPKTKLEEAVAFIELIATDRLPGVSIGPRQRQMAYKLFESLTVTSSQPKE